MSKNVTLYLCKTCSDVNKCMFSTRVLGNTCHNYWQLLQEYCWNFQMFATICWFYEKFNIPTIFDVIQKWWRHQNARCKIISSYIIFILKLVPKCSFMVKQLSYHTLMLGNEYVQKSFKHWVYKWFHPSFSGHGVCCNPLTFCWCHKVLAWVETKYGYLIVDDCELNTKLSFELGELWQRINSNFAIVWAL